MSSSSQRRSPATSSITSGCACPTTSTSSTAPSSSRRPSTSSGKLRRDRLSCDRDPLRRPHPCPAPRVPDRRLEHRRGRDRDRRRDRVGICGAARLRDRLVRRVHVGLGDDLAAARRAARGRGRRGADRARRAARPEARRPARSSCWPSTSPWDSFASILAGEPPGARRSSASCSRSPRSRSCGGWRAQKRRVGTALGSSGDDRRRVPDRCLLLAVAVPARRDRRQRPPAGGGPTRWRPWR